MMLATFAHDVRTPLTGILGLAELLATAGLPERERGWVASIKDAGEHLLALTNLMIEGARAGSGQLRPRQETFDLAHLVEALAASLKGRAETKKLLCETVITPELPAYAKGDPALIRTAVDNLLANAVKFTAHGKVALTVSVRSVRGKFALSFAVTDSGIGMKAAEQQGLFRPFARGDDARKFGGAGLGLAQVRRLAAAMSGHVTVTSSPGGGSRFELTVMLAPAEPAESQPAALRQPALRVLYVDDNPYRRVVMNALLCELGHRGDFAGSGEAAAAAVGGGDYDAVVLDIALGGIDGLEARIRAFAGAAEIPVIGIAGERHVTADAFPAMSACLTKPVSACALAEALARVTGSRAFRSQD